MPINYFDSSALGKHYHPEVGSDEVDRLISETGASHLISRLTIIEMHSVYAKKVRTGKLTLEEFRKVTRKFRGDVAARRIRIVRMTVSHFHKAELLLRNISPMKNLRTLDAIQLATALSAAEHKIPIHFICADQVLCDIAKSSGLIVFNPEAPTPLSST